MILSYGVVDKNTKQWILITWKNGQKIIPNISVPLNKYHHLRFKNSVNVYCCHRAYLSAQLIRRQRSLVQAPALVTFLFRGKKKKHERQIKITDHCWKGVKQTNTGLTGFFFSSTYLTNLWDQKLWFKELFYGLCDVLSICVCTSVRGLQPSQYVMYTVIHTHDRPITSLEWNVVVSVGNRR